MKRLFDVVAEDPPFALLNTVAFEAAVPLDEGEEEEAEEEEAASTASSSLILVAQ